MPTHREHMRITDGLDPEIPPHYDAILLTGDIVGDICAVRLVVAGTTQPGHYYGPIPIEQYWVTIQVARPSSQDWVIYGLQYVNGVEENYNTPVTRNGSILTFEWPLKWILHGYYIIGIDAAIFSESSVDDISDESMMNMGVPRLLPLPLAVRILAVIGALVSVTLLAVYLLRKFFQRRVLSTS